MARAARAVIRPQARLMLGRSVVVRVANAVPQNELNFPPNPSDLGVPHPKWTTWQHVGARLTELTQAIYFLSAQGGASRIRFPQLDRPYQTGIVMAQRIDPWTHGMAAQQCLRRCLQ